MITIPQPLPAQALGRAGLFKYEVARGGHFAAFEQPHLLVAELRASLATLRCRNGSR
jgi:hypothetical protein